LRLPLTLSQQFCSQINDSVYEVCKPTNRRPLIEVVFFHGVELEGSEDTFLTTWLSRDQSQLWLNWLSEDLPDARILIVSYDAAARRTASKGNVDMYFTVENLVHDLVGAQVGVNGCPVVLVGHSLGGLVIKELCVQADSMVSREPSMEAFKLLLLSIKGLFFFATPHHGSGMADVMAYPKGLLFERMVPLDTATNRSNAHFVQLQRKYGWITSGVGERRPVSLVSP
jgi:triacylglycerol esterase/lipase EstA (alpha/beta hydrolase family)